MQINDSLIKAGIQYKKELLVAPMVAFDEIKPYFNIRTGVQGTVVGGILSVDAQFRPYRSEKGASKGIKIVPHQWTAYLGDLVKEFDPNLILGTLYTERTALKPDAMKIAKIIALNVALKAGEALYDNLFTAKYNALGDETADLFNGFSTIFKKAVTDGEATELKGNYMDLSATPIDRSNAGDILTGVWRNANKHLKKKGKMYVSPSIIELYEEWYQDQFQAAAWNKDYQQRKLHSSRGKCEFVELDNMEEQDYIFLTHKDNLNIGFDQESDKEEVEIRRCDNPKMVQLFMKTHFGAGYETIMPEFLCGAKIQKA